jgi:hypothetical protein
MGKVLSWLKNPWKYFQGLFLRFFNVDKPVLLADIIKSFLCIKPKRFYEQGNDLKYSGG